MANITQFFSTLFGVVWAVLNIQIPIGNDIYITPWAIFLFCLIIALLIKFLFKKQKEE